MKNAIASRKAMRAMSRSAARVVCSCSTTITRTIARMMRNPRIVGFMLDKKRLMSGSGHVGAHSERSCYKGSPGEPGEPGPPLGRRVKPGGKRGEERERAVEVVEPVRCPVVVREEEEPEPDLGDEQSLREREQVRDDASRLAPPVIRDAGEDRGGPRDPEHEVCDGAVRR